MAHNDSDLKSLFDQLGGVLPAVGNSFNPLDDRAVSQIEAQFELPIPNSVRQCLQHFGAVVFQESICFHPDEPFPVTYSPSGIGVVSGLLGQVHPDYPKAKRISILHLLRLRSRDNGTSFVPIGDTTAGNLILVSMCPEDYGEVYFWHHDAPVGNDHYHVSTSFEAWLKSLYREKSST